MRLPLAELSASAEAAWQQLRQHADWSLGFWLAWLFTDHLATAEALATRLDGRHAGPPALRLTLDEDAVPVLLALLGGPVHPGAWVLARGRGDAGRAAWVNLHQRLNERREQLRARMHGGVVLVGPLAWKGPARDAAPDLWSIRSLLLEVEGPVPALRPPPISGRDQPSLERPERQAPDEDLARNGLRRALAAGDLAAETVARLRLAQALLARDAPALAREEAALAAERAPAAPARARAFALQAEAEEALGDPVAAAEHYARALQVVGPASDREAVKWAVLLSRLHSQGGRAHEAEAAARDAVKRAQALGSGGERDLGVALNSLGDALLDLIRPEDARRAYQESLDIRRRSRAVQGDGPQVLRDLSISLERLGGALQALGLVEEARLAFEESLALCRGLRKGLGDRPQVLRDLSISLERLGDVLNTIGRPEEAIVAFQEGLELRRLLRTALSDKPQVLRDLSISLQNSGDALLSLARTEEALQAIQESVSLQRQLRELLGDRPQVLRDLAIGLNHLGNALRDQGRPEEARALHGEALALDEQLLAVLGDTPQVHAAREMSRAMLAALDPPTD